MTRTSIGQTARPNRRSLWAALSAYLRVRARERGGVARADAARRASDWEAAVRQYEAYLGGAPRDLGIRLRLIKTLYAAGCLDEAEAQTRAAAAARPDKVELKALLAEILAARQASVPIRDFGRFRDGLVIPQAPASAVESVVALVHGLDRGPDDVEATLEGLRRSMMPVDTILVVLADGQYEEYGLAAGPARPVDGERIDAALAGADAVLTLDAGVIIDAQALGWLHHAADVTGAVAAYGDDDCRAAVNGDASCSAPAFYGAPHPLDIATSPRLPAAVLLRGPAIRSAPMPQVRDRLRAAMDMGPVAHVPLLLASRAGEVAVPEVYLSPSAQAGAGVRILTIIPTRDEGVALLRMIDSLISSASDLSRLDILVVDNGSTEPATLALLDALVRDGRARVLRIDEPFNWSRLNNLAAAGAEADILLFANNDMKMVTAGWDDRLRASLALPDVGVVGARLTYPSGQVQHAGMALGGLSGRPVHEGLGAAAAEPGPLRRWVRSRPAAAVTGAFMGVRREVFEAAGGFNADEFAVGCNDIDFCLRARALNWTVLYAADLELVHWESHSRGHDDTEAKMRRAEAELAALDRLWGEDARRDPSRNPHWVNHETLIFHGLRQPNAAEVEAWIRESVTAWGRSGSV